MNLSVNLIKMWFAFSMNLPHWNQKRRGALLISAIHGLQKTWQKQSGCVVVRKDVTGEQCRLRIISSIAELVDLSANVLHSRVKTTIDVWSRSARMNRPQCGRLQTLFCTRTLGQVDRSVHLVLNCSLRLVGSLCAQAENHQGNDQVSIATFSTTFSFVSSTSDASLHPINLNPPPTLAQLPPVTPSGSPCPPQRNAFLNHPLWTSSHLPSSNPAMMSLSPLSLT